MIRPDESKQTGSRMATKVRFFIHGLWSGSPPDTRGRSPVRKSRTPDLCGVSGNGYPYRDISERHEIFP